MTFSNGTVGDLQASSKVNNKGQFTTCSYYSAGEYLGYFQSAEFASSDADAVLQFCLDNYANRDAHWPSAIATSLPLLPLSIILSSWLWAAKVARVGGAVEVLPGVAWVGSEDVVPAGLVFGGAAGLYLTVVCALMAWVGTHITPRQAPSPRP